MLNPNENNFFTNSLNTDIAHLIYKKYLGNYFVISTLSTVSKDFNSAVKNYIFNIYKEKNKDIGSYEDFISKLEKFDVNKFTKYEKDLIINNLC